MFRLVQTRYIEFPNIMLCVTIYYIVCMQVYMCICCDIYVCVCLYLLVCSAWALPVFSICYYMLAWHACIPTGNSMICIAHSKLDRDSSTSIRCRRCFRAFAAVWQFVYSYTRVCVCVLLFKTIIYY